MRKPRKTTPVYTNRPELVDFRNAYVSVVSQIDGAEHPEMERAYGGVENHGRLLDRLGKI
jgi:hypothetical protein